MLRSLHHLPSWSRGSTLSAPSSLRTEVCPPTLRQAPHGAWRRAIFWLLAPAPHASTPAPQRLHGVRQDFIAQLADVGGDEARALGQRIADAPSLRDLWHLRSPLYRAIGVAHSQSVAEERLARLNRHFPTRSPRSQFAAL